MARTEVIKLPADYTKLTSAQRKKVREKYTKLQDNKCMFCKSSLDQKPIEEHKINWSLFPKGFTRYPIHLQHDHQTNLTEGAVHAYCNAVLWQYHHK